LSTATRNDEKIRFGSGHEKGSRGVGVSVHATDDYTTVGDFPFSGIVVPSPGLVDAGSKECLSISTEGNSVIELDRRYTVSDDSSGQKSALPPTSPSVIKVLLSAVLTQTPESSLNLMTERPVFCSMTSKFPSLSKSRPLGVFKPVWATATSNPFAISGTN
jgi:hypothetical protein